MNVTITEDWLLQFADEEIAEPSGYLTPRDRQELERRRRDREATSSDGEASAVRNPPKPRRVVK